MAVDPYGGHDLPHPLRPLLSDIVGSDYVADSDFAIWAYSRDSSGFPPRTPGIIVRPETTGQVSEIVRLANREGISIVPRGGGTAYGRPPGDPGRSICIDLTRMRSLLDLNEVNRTVTVEAGMVCTELETRLRGQGLYAHTVYGPADSVTVGGVVSGVSGGGGGQMFSSAGHNEPYIVGVKAVLPTGEVIETGTRSNTRAGMFAPVAHGPNLTGLFVGHMGIFGITTEVTLQVFPWPPYEEFGGVNYRYERLEDAYKAFLALALQPEKPFSLLGLMGPGPKGIARTSDWWIAYKVHGFTPAEVNAKLELAKRAINEAPSPEEWNSPAVRKLGEKILKYPHDVMPRRLGMWSMPEPLAPRDGTLELVRGILELMEGELKGWEGRFRSGGSAIWMHGEQNYLSFPFYHDESDFEARDKSLEVWKKAADLCVQMGAMFCVLDKEIGDICAAYFPPEYRKLLTQLKAGIDPNNIMNPHLLGMP
ncbi:MAG: FAD-binding oxidoreductase [Dehalococcoidia bacterium]